MPLVRVESLTMSLDGYVAGTNQSLQQPMGERGSTLHAWAFSTRTFQQQVFGRAEGATGVDDDFAQRGFRNIGAWILGRNMFAHSRGPWTDDGWRGWWGDEPPYHVDTYILTHYAREPLVMEGGTTFHFVTGGIHEALERARATAGDKDIRIGGGAATVRQFLAAQLIDEMHVAISPVLLGAGESLFHGLDLPSLGYKVTTHVATPLATHVVFGR